MALIFKMFRPVIRPGTGGFILTLRWCMPVMAILAVGCHKAEDTTAAPPPAPVAAPAAPDANQGSATAASPMPPQGPDTTQMQMNPNASLVRTNGEPDLRALNRALLRWRMANQRKPSTFEEFAATAGVTIPPPPPGERYALAANGHITLVKQ